MAEARGYYSVWLTLKDSDTVDEFYKYRGEELPQVGEVIEVVRFLRDRPTRARVTGVDVDFQSQPRITAIQIEQLGRGEKPVAHGLSRRNAVEALSW